MLRRRTKPWFYCAPALLLILIIIVFPIAYTGYISLTNMNLYHWQSSVWATMPERFSNSTPAFSQR